MHRIDAADYVVESGKNKFSDGDPSVPRLPTVLGVAWLNDVQEELAQLVEAAGGTLAKGTAQLKDLLPLRLVANTWSALQTFAASVVASATTGTAVTGYSDSSGTGGEFRSSSGRGIYAWSSTGNGAQVKAYGDVPALVVHGTRTGGHICLEDIGAVAPSPDAPDGTLTTFEGKLLWKKYGVWKEVAFV